MFSGIERFAGIDNKCSVAFEDIKKLITNSAHIERKSCRDGHFYMRACVRSCVRACVRARARARVRARPRARASIRAGVRAHNKRVRRIKPHNQRCGGMLLAESLFANKCDSFANTGPLGRLRQRRGRRL